MAERRPPGFTVDLDFYDSAEVMSLPRRIRAAAVGVWTLCGAYSAKKLYDGYVGAEMLKQLGCTPAIRAALVATTDDSGKPSPLWIDAPDGGIQFTRWPKWQRTAEEVKTFRQSEAERKKVARDKAKNAPRNGHVDSTRVASDAHVSNSQATVKQSEKTTRGEADARDMTTEHAVTSGDSKMSARTSGGQSAAVRAESHDPKTEPETEPKTKSFPVVNLGGGLTSADADTPRPQCPDHEENHTGPCKPCERRRKWDENHAQLTAAIEANRKHTLAQIAANCPDCHGTNLIDIGDNEVRKCDHRKAATA